MSFPQNMTVGQIRELVENPGVAIRAPATAVLTIDSRDRVIIDPATGYRIDTTTPYEIYINKQQTLMNGYFTRIAMSEINMQWGIPNVNETNNTLLIQRGAAAGPSTVVDSFQLVLFERFYTPKELAAAIQGLLNNAGGVFGVTTWQCTWQSDANNFAIAETSGTIPFRIKPQNIGFADDLCNLMGFSYPSSEFTVRIVGSFASMQYTPYFDVVSSNITKKQNVRDNGTSFLTGQNLLCRVYLSQPGVNVARDATVPGNDADTSIVGTRPFTLYREYSVPKQIYWDTKEFISVVDLQLVDYKGRTLYSKPQTASLAPPLSFTGDASQYQLTLQVTET